MATVGLEAGVHVYFALLAILVSAALLSLVYKGAVNGKIFRGLAVATAVFLWLSWFTVIHTYTVAYAGDRTVLKGNPQTAIAHNFGMETKEHIFYTGLFLGTILPIVAYTVDPKSPGGRRLFMWMLVLLIIGGFLMEGLGAWVSASAKQAWAAKAGG